MRMISRLATICLLLSNTVFAGGIGSGGSPPSVIDIESATMALLEFGASKGDFIRVTSPDEVAFLQPIVHSPETAELLAQDITTGNVVKFRVNAANPSSRLLRQKRFDAVQILKDNRNNNLKVDTVSSDSLPLDDSSVPSVVDDSEATPNKEVDLSADSNEAQPTSDQ